MNIKLFIRQYIKMAAQKIYLPAVYRFYSHRETVPSLIIFADAHHDTCPESMRSLRSELKRRLDGKGGGQLKELYLDYQNASFLQTIRHMTLFMKLYAQAGAVVICDNFLPAAGCRKKPETKVIQLWHACGALKRFGYDALEDIPKNYRGNVFRNTDRVTVSSPLCVEPFAAAMRLPKESVWPAGVCRTDRYFSDVWKKRMHEKLLEAVPAAKGKKIVVWAPTFRGRPGEPHRLALDLEDLACRLGEEYLIIEKQHPHVREEAGDGDGKPSGRVIRNCPLTTQELFPSADVLIADYSSLIYEYLLFEKPLILYIPDFDRYEKARGFYMSHSEIPGQRVYTQEDLADAVRGALGPEDPKEREERERFLSRWMSCCDGHSTRRIADYLLGEEESSSRPEE